MTLIAVSDARMKRMQNQKVAFAGWCLSKHWKGLQELDFEVSSSTVSEWITSIHPVLRTVFGTRIRIQISSVCPPLTWRSFLVRLHKFCVV